MNHPDQGLVSPSDIADMAGVSRGAVSNWRKRTHDFPEAVAGTPAKPLFSRRAVIAWLEPRGHKPIEDAGETNVWAALNLVRGRLSADEAAELVLSLAVSRKTGYAPDIDIPQVASETLEKLQEAIESVDVKNLAAAADFALERLAKAQGKAGADFGFVGSRTTRILASLAAAKQGNVLYDPACGIGAALIESVMLGARPARLIGHDINSRALRIASMRAKLRGVALELSQTDVLSEDIEPALQADVILLEPPFGVRLEVPARLTDARFHFGTPPRSSADTAWLQHAVSHLTDTGRAYVLSPAGPLFRGGEEGKIRTELVRRGCVEAVVGLPGKLLPHTSIPLALWVLRRPVIGVRTAKILFIDASTAVSPEADIAAWLTEPASRRQVENITVPTTDVLAADSVLTPHRWIDRVEREPSEVTEAFAGSSAAISDTLLRLKSDSFAFDYLDAFPASRVMTIGDLIDQGVLDLRPGRPKERYAEAPEELRQRIATAADIRDGTLLETGIDADYTGYSDQTLEGDVLTTTMNTIRARVDKVGGHLPSTGVYRLRVRDHEVLSPSYLAMMLTGSWNGRFQGGSTIQRASIRDLEVPLVPRSDQEKIESAVRSLMTLREHAEYLAAEAKTARLSLLDAVRYNAPLMNSRRTRSRVAAKIQGATPAPDEDTRNAVARRTLKAPNKDLSGKILPARHEKQTSDTEGKE